MFARKIDTLPKSLKERVAIASLGAAGYLTRLTRGRGFSRIANLVSALFSAGSQDLVVHLLCDTKVTVRLDDPYWSRLISAGYDYELELWALLKRLNEIKYFFVDCGANKGYWSLLVSSEAFGKNDVVAIEPMPETFEALTRNLALNNRKITTMQKAVSTESGLVLPLYFRGDHSGTTLEEHWNHSPGMATRVVNVESICIDHIVAEIDPEIPLVLKLDIEGHEKAALSGASIAIKRGALLIFEEHGSSKNAELTKYIMKTLRLRVFFLEDDGSLTTIHAAEAVISRKTNHQRGYNLCACAEDSVFFSFLTSASKSNR